jgi:2-keto-3-deoxy-L-rhamnonate aldolase RhmA
MFGKAPSSKSFPSRINVSHLAFKVVEEGAEAVHDVDDVTSLEGVERVSYGDEDLEREMDAILEEYERADVLTDEEEYAKGAAYHGIQSATQPLLIV